MPNSPKARPTTKARNGRGHIRQRPDGRWEGRWTDRDGKQHSVYARTADDCADKLTLAQAQHLAGLPTPNRRQRFGPYLDQWLAEHVQPVKPDSTTTNYRWAVEHHIAPALGKRLLIDVGVDEVQKLLNHLAEKRPKGKGLSAASVHVVRAVLSGVLGHAARTGLIARNPVPLARSPKAQPATHATEPGAIIGPELARRVLEAVAGDPHEAFYVLALAVGLRHSELLGLRWADLDWTARTIALRHQLKRYRGGTWELVPLKTERSRATLALPAVAEAALKRHRAAQREARLAAPAWIDHDLVFCGPTGEPLWDVMMRVRWHRLCQAKGLPYLKVHALRHGTATLLLATGATLHEVREALRHTSFTTTARFYAHASGEMRRATADRLDGVFGSRKEGTG